MCMDLCGPLRDVDGLMKLRQRYQLSQSWQVDPGAGIPEADKHP